MGADSKVAGSEIFFRPEKLLFAFLWVFFLFQAPSFAAPATQFVFLPSSSPAAGTTYDLSGAHSVTFDVEARDGSNTLDPTFNGTVTVGLYDTSSGQLSDPNAVYVSGGTSITGLAPLAFVGGKLSFGITFGAGSDSEEVSLGGSAITTGDIYPSSGGFVVKGISQSYFLEPLNVESYPTNTQPYVPSPSPTPSVDFLVSTQDPVVGTTNFAFLVPSGTGVTGSSGIDSGAAAFALTDFSAGYAFGGAGVTVTFYVASPSSQPATMDYQVLFHYNGSLADFNNPPAQDTVFQGAVSTNSSSFGGGSSVPLSVPGFAGFQPFMSDGQVIVRLWSPSGSAPMSVLYMSTQGKFPFAKIPYSPQNALPLRAVLSPSVTGNGSSTSLQYVLTNQFSSPVSFIQIQIPSDGSGNFWTLSSPSASSGTVAVSVPASSSAPGTLTWTMSVGAALQPGNTLTLTLPATAPNLSAAGWAFPIVSALSDTDSGILTDSSQAVIGTLGVPSKPTSFLAVPSNLNNGGNRVDLSWATVSSEGVTGYVLTRNPTGASFPMTISPNSVSTYVDSTVGNNPSSYDYTLVAQNAVAQSSATVVSGVVPYANPTTVTNLQALTGGNNVQLSWTAPVSVPGSYAIGGYQVYRVTTSGQESSSTPVTTVAASPFNDTGVDLGSLTAGTNYYYQISAIDNQYAPAGPPLSPHNGNFSSEVSAFPPGFPPTGITAVLTSTTPDTLTVSWTAPTGNQGVLSNYYLYRGVNGVPVTTGAPYATLGSSTVSYDDTGVSAGNTYQYEVAAIYPGPVTTNFSGIAIGNVGPPAPASLSVNPSNTAVTLSWPAVVATPSVSGYVLYRDATPVGTVTAPTLSFTDSTAPADTTLSYQVAAVDSTGVTGALLTPAVTTARLPNTPSGLSALADGTAPRTQADISWASTSETLVNGYKLYRGTSSAFPPANPVTTNLGLVTASPDPGLTPGTIYYYFLKAQNTLGGLSSLAGPIGIQIPPSPPTGLTAVSSAAAVTLTWNSNAAGNAVQHYSVYRTGGAGPATFSPISPSGGAAVTYQDLTASPGVDYAYHVTATNVGSGVTVAGGESSSSAIVAWGLKPQTPTGLTASVDTSNNITLNWSAITDANAQSVSVLVNSTPTATVTPSVTTYSYAGLPDATYTFAIETNNAYGTGAGTQVSILTYPGAPTISSLGQTNSGSVTITWNTQTSPTNYKIYRQQGAGASQPLTTVSAASLAFPVTLSYSTLPGQTYTYYVSAINATGEGPLSGGRLLQNAPSAPSGLTALSGVSPSTVQVNLSWAANGATEGVTGYTVYRASASAGPFTALAPSPSGTTFSDSSVSGATVYYYQVSAESGGIESFLNNANAVPVTAYEAPNTPALPSVTAGDQQLTLNWTAVSQTTYPVAGYNLYRSNSASVTGPKVNATPIPTTSFINTGLTDGTTDYYFLQTVDNQGHGSTYAGPVSETPVKAPGVPTNVTGKPGDGAAQITWTASVPGTLPIGEYLLIRDDITASSLVTLGPLPASPTGYEDTGLSNTHTYAYQVQAVDNSDIESGVHVSPLSSSVTVSPGVNVNPPSSVDAVGAPGAVTLTWVDSYVGPLNGPVTGYQIFRATSLTGTYTALPSGVAIGVLTYTDSTVTNGTTYYYYMVASNSNSTPVTSIASVTVHATPAGAPPAPSGLTALDGDQSVALTWAPNPVLDNVAVSYYVVNRTSPPGSPATVASPAVSLTDSGLTNGQTYSYTLQAVNANGTIGVASGSINGYPYVMGAPTPVTSASDSTGVNLSWTSPASSFPVTAFAVFRNDFGATVIYSPASALTIVSITSFSDLTGTLGQLYNYQVAAMDDKGHLGPVSSSDLDGKANPPPAPTSFTALAGDQEIILDWAPVVKTTDSLPVSYYILTGSDGLSVTLTGQTYYEDVAGQHGSTLSNDNPVTYTLVSVDASGQFTVAHMSAAAGPVSGTADSANVNPPTDVKAQAVTTNEIELTWTPANYETKSVSYYNVYRASSFTGSYSKIAKVLNPLATPATLFDNTGLSPNTTYYYFVRSFDSISSTESCDSNHAYATTAAPTAGVPTVTMGELAFDKNLFLPLTGQQLSIYYVVPNSGWVQLTVYNISGYPVRFLSPGNATANVQAGTVWDGKDRNGNTVASGIYLIEIKAPGFHQVRKVAVVK